MATSDPDCQYILNLHRGPCQGRRVPKVTEARVSSEVVLLRLGVPFGAGLLCKSTEPQGRLRPGACPCGGRGLPSHDV